MTPDNIFQPVPPVDESIAPPSTRDYSVAPTVHAPQSEEQGGSQDFSEIYQTPDPDNAPTVLQTDATVFGEQLGKGTDPDDSGGLAYGGRSTNNPMNYIALPPEWAKIVKPGYAVPIWNPEHPDKVVWGIHADKGPANYIQQRGVGIDVAPSIAAQLGFQGKGTVQFDPSKARPLSREEAQGMVAEASADPSRLTASTDKGGAMPQGQGQDVTPKEIIQYDDGSYDLGNGVRGFPDGTVHVVTGNSTTEHIPDSTQPSGYRQRTYSTKPAASKDPSDIFIKEAAKKGIMRSDYPEGKEGDDQFSSEAKLVLGAGVADDIAEGIINGTQPPSTQGLYRNGPQVRAKLAQRGYDLKTAELDYKATIRHMASMNSSKQITFYNAVQTAHDSLDLVDQFATEWKSNSNFGPLNRARLIAAANGAYGEEQAKVARKLQAQITDLTSELGQVYMGGNSPTDHSLELAGKNLSADWSEGVLHDMTDLARKNLKIRLNSLNSSPVLGLAKQADQPPATAPTLPGSPAASATPAPSPVATKRVTGHYYKNSKGEDLGMWDGTKFVK